MALLFIWLATFVVIGNAFGAIGITVARAMGREPSTLMRALFHETRPFYWPATALWAGLHILTGTSPVMVGVVVAMWTFAWFGGPDDDDRWKRRRKRLADRVAVAGHRLVVAPTP